jgi:hypothetical protein
MRELLARGARVCELAVPRAAYPEAIAETPTISSLIKGRRMAKAVDDGGRGARLARRDEGAH